MLRIIFLIIFLFNTVSLCKEQKNNSFGWPENILKQLTLREKIGQLFIVAATSKREMLEENLASKKWVCPYNLDDNYIKKLIKDYKIGGVVFLYGNSPGLQLKKIREYQALSKTPLITTQDCEWGINMRHPDAIKFPRNLTLGAIQNNKLIYDLGLEIGRQCKLVGVHMNFSPVADCNYNPDNPVIHDRSFSDDPNLVSECAYNMALGLKDAGVLPCAKHFPGHGDTIADSHLDLPILDHDIKRLESIELAPFKYLIKNCTNTIDAVMLAHLKVPALDDKNITTFSKKIVTELLEQKIGFSGLKITDALGMGAVTKNFNPGEIEHKAFLAGFDILLCPLDTGKAIDLIEKSILSGEVSEQELNKRVLKILRAKSKIILNNNNNKIDINPEELLKEINNNHAKKLKAKLYQEAITIVKDKYNLIPVRVNSKSSKISLSQDTEIYKILKIIKKSKNSNLAKTIIFYENCVLVSLIKLNKFSDQNFGLSKADLDILKQIKKLNKKLIVVLYGTPYAIKFVDFADAIILAYEDDSDAHKAVEKVLSGEFKATGKLPIKI